MNLNCRSVVAPMLCVLTIFAQQALDNDGVVKLVRAGVSEDVVIDMVKNQPGRYSTTPDEMIALKSAGVTDKIISAMVNKNVNATSEMKPSATIASPNSPELVLH